MTTDALNELQALHDELLREAQAKGISFEEELVELRDWAFGSPEVIDVHDKPLQREISEHGHGTYVEDPETQDAIWRGER